MTKAKSKEWVGEGKSRKLQPVDVEVKQAADTKKLSKVVDRDEEAARKESEKRNAEALKSPVYNRDVKKKAAPKKKAAKKPSSKK